MDRNQELNELNQFLSKGTQRFPFRDLLGPWGATSLSWWSQGDTACMEELLAFERDTWAQPCYLQGLARSARTIQMGVSEIVVYPQLIKATLMEKKIINQQI